jgi:predicted Zn finger-like uncharacterized protein
MLIVCPTCATSYDIALASLPPSGRQVRCVRCRAVWRAAPSRADKLLAAADAFAPAPQAEAFAAEPAYAHGRDDGAPADWSDTDVVAVEPDLAAGEGDTTVEVDAPSIAPVEDGDGEPPIEAEAGHVTADPAAADVEPLEDIETYAARREARNLNSRWWRWPLTNLQSGLVVLLIVDAILIGWRNDLVRILPQTASFYSTIGLPVNLRGVIFDGVVTTAEQHDGVPILVVGGNIVNDSRRIVDVPRLKFVVRNAANEEIYSWTAVPPRASLAPGETVAFHSRLASPPPDGRDVLVRFVTRNDIIAGSR